MRPIQPTPFSEKVASRADLAKKTKEGNVAYNENRKRWAVVKDRRNPCDLFWSKVAFRQAGCWDWMGCRVNGGYGKFWDGRNVYAHRFAYEDVVGKIPDGLTLDHLCRNHKCVRPLHLEAVSLTENQARGESVCVQNTRKTYCKHGHPFDQSNTRIRPDGKRDCKACARAYSHQRWKRVVREKAKKR